MRSDTKPAALAPETTAAVVSIGTVKDGLVVVHCSGTLIAPTLVLTAAHCLYAPKPGVEPVDACSLGASGRDDEYASLVISPNATTPTSTPSNDLFAVTGSIRFPSQADAQGLCGNDIALLRLREPLATAPIEPRLDAVATPGERFDVVGFGSHAVGGLRDDGVRKRRNGNHVHCVGSECAALDASVHPNEWLSMDARACSGDSGGPALDAQSRIIGVVSRGYADCTGIIYTAVSRWAEQIRSELRNETAP